MVISEIVENLMPFCAVRGREEPYLNAIGYELSKFAPTKTNHLYSVCHFEGKNNTHKKILLIAHCTTPGYLATKISDDGLVKIVPIDGVGNVAPITTWVPPFLPVEKEIVGKAVTIYGKRAIEGVVPAPPVHYQVCVGEVAKADGIYVATGYNKNQTEKIVTPGDAVVYSPYLCRSLNSKFFAPLLEYRLPSAVLLRIAEILSKKTPSCNISIAITGGSNFSGAVQAIQQEQPDEIIVMGCTNAESYKATGIEDNVGVVQCFGTGVHYEYSEKLERYMISQEISHQRVANIYTTDTLADICGYVGKGYPTAMFAVPVQYSRSSVSQAREDSAEYLAQQLSECLHKEGAI